MSDVNEFNAQTGQVVFRPYTQEELLKIQQDLDMVADPETTPAPEDPVKLSALAKLKAIGLTDEEARAIVGL